MGIKGLASDTTICKSRGRIVVSVSQTKARVSDRYRNLISWTRCQKLYT